MTLNVRVQPAGDPLSFGREQVVRIGRDGDCEVSVGRVRIEGRWTVSKIHAEVSWDGSRWSTLTVSDKQGLLVVYEPGYEEVPLESGRAWVPVRHRWSYGVGRPGRQFHVVCETDDHLGPAGMAGRHPLPHAPGATRLDDEPTAGIDTVFALSLTPLELEVLMSYYSDFTVLPRPATLGPRSHDEAARRLGRSVDSTRKAIERVNDKIARFDGAPAIASGRNVSPEIGRWLARTGALDPR